jgi:hypothetical protein
VKIRSQLEIKRKKGQFIGAFAVYGYLKDEEDHNKLVVDTFASEVVRAIFKWKLEGMSQGRIADKLNIQGVLCPMEYDKKKLIEKLVDYEELKAENERLKKQLAKQS